MEPRGSMRRTTIPSITITTRTLIRPIAACGTRHRHTTTSDTDSGRFLATPTASPRRATTRVYSSAQGTTLEPLKGQLPLLINSDPPDHSRLRHLADRLFTRSAVAPLEEAIRALARELIGPHRARGRIDIIADFAARLPMAVLCRLLGVPKQDEDMLRGWTDTVVHRDEGVFEMPEAGLQATLRIFGYYEDDLRRRAGLPPQADLIASFIEAEATED